jgi:hypothetical protein
MKSSLLSNVSTICAYCTSDWSHLRASDRACNMLRMVQPYRLTDNHPLFIAAFSNNTNLFDSSDDNTDHTTSNATSALPHLSTSEVMDDSGQEVVHHMNDTKRVDASKLHELNVLLWHMCGSSEDESMIELLLHNGANPNFVLYNRHTLLQCVNRQREIGVRLSTLLLKHGALCDTGTLKHRHFNEESVWCCNSVAPNELLKKAGAMQWLHNDVNCDRHLRDLVTKAARRSQNTFGGTCAQLVEAVVFWMNNLPSCDLHVPLYNEAEKERDLMLFGSDEHKYALSLCPYRVHDIVLFSDIGGPGPHPTELNDAGKFQSLPQVRTKLDERVIAVVTDRAIGYDGITPCVRLHFDEWRTTIDEWQYHTSPRIEAISDTKLKLHGWPLNGRVGDNHRISPFTCVPPQPTLPLPIHPLQTIYERLMTMKDWKQMKPIIDDRLLQQRTIVIQQIMIIIPSLPLVMAQLIGSCLY